MRFYKDFKEALSEIKRDLAEMGIEVHPKTYQDKYIADDPNFATLELQNYVYTVLHPNPDDLGPVQPWADMEFEERISGIKYNPGNSWKKRLDVWEQFLESDGRFAYTYPERMAHQLDIIADEAEDNPDSRQLYMGIWDPNKDIYRLGGLSRVPCSLGYLFQIRGGILNVTYFMRSMDYVTHMENDMYLAHMLQRWMANRIGVPEGRFTHFVASLHIFKKDVKGVF